MDKTCQISYERFEIDIWMKNPFIYKIYLEQRKTETELDHSLAQQVGGMCWEAFKSTKKNKTIRSDIGLVLYFTFLAHVANKILILGSWWHIWCCWE